MAELALRLTQTRPKKTRSKGAGHEGLTLVLVHIPIDEALKRRSNVHGKFLVGIDVSRMKEGALKELMLFHSGSYEIGEVEEGYYKDLELGGEHSGLEEYAHYPIAPTEEEIFRFLDSLAKARVEKKICEFLHTCAYRSEELIGSGSDGRAYLKEVDPEVALDARVKEQIASLRERAQVLNEMMEARERERDRKQQELKKRALAILEEFGTEQQQEEWGGEEIKIGKIRELAKKRGVYDRLYPKKEKP